MNHFADEVNVNGLGHIGLSSRRRRSGKLALGCNREYERADGI